MKGIKFLLLLTVFGFVQCSPESTSKPTPTKPKTAMQHENAVAQVVEEVVEVESIDSTTVSFLISLSESEGMLPSYWKEILSQVYPLTEHFNYTVNRVWYGKDEALAIILNASNDVSFEQYLFTCVKGKAVDFLLLTKDADCDGNSCPIVKHSWLDDFLVEVVTENIEQSIPNPETIVQYEIKGNGNIILSTQFTEIRNNNKASIFPEFPIGKRLKFKDEGAVSTTYIVRISETDFIFEIGVEGRYTSGKVSLISDQTIEIETQFGEVQAYPTQIQPNEHTLRCLQALYFPTGEVAGLSDQIMILWNVAEECGNFSLLDKQIGWRD